MYAFQGIFRRPADEFTSMIEEHRPAPFNPPDTSGLHFYPESIEAMAVARGAWWTANNLPTTPREQRWMAQHDTESVPPTPGHSGIGIASRKGD